MYTSNEHLEHVSQSGTNLLWVCYVDNLCDGATAIWGNSVARRRGHLKLDGLHETKYM
jgi:hypothetical protein